MVSIRHLLILEIDLIFLRFAYDKKFVFWRVLRSNSLVAQWSWVPISFLPCLIYLYSLCDIPPLFWMFSILERVGYTATFSATFLALGCCQPLFRALESYLLPPLALILSSLIFYERIRLRHQKDVAFAFFTSLTSAVSFAPSFYSSGVSVVKKAIIKMRGLCFITIFLVALLMTGSIFLLDKM